MRPRYYCDHCHRGNGNPSAMQRHEKGCTKNPNRKCGMCALREKEDGEPLAPPTDELVRVLDAQGFDAMVEAANGCPACILAVLRTKWVWRKAQGCYIIDGPADGREAWRYEEAKEKWWKMFNDTKEQA